MNRSLAFLAVAVVITAISIAVLFAAQRPTPEDTNAVAINVTSRQWNYTPSEIRVKEGQTVILHLRSIDVPHGFAIEEYRVNVFLPPGETVDVKFIANQAGEFQYFCNVFCGTGHPNHKGKLIVEK
ncbi:MAG TPA: cupredoxin domain-containing protein [Nitrososphaerales archaeon]